MMIFQTTPQMLNFGSWIDPVTGRSRWISPPRSFRSATASRTGSFVASAVHRIAEGELVEEDLVLRVQLSFSMWYLRFR
jgi:hypothetical protein